MNIWCNTLIHNYNTGRNSIIYNNTILISVIYSVTTYDNNKRKWRIKGKLCLEYWDTWIGERNILSKYWSVWRTQAKTSPSLFLPKQRFLKTVIIAPSKPFPYCSPICQFFSTPIIRYYIFDSLWFMIFTRLKTCCTCIMCLYYVTNMLHILLLMYMCLYWSLVAILWSRLTTRETTAISCHGDCQ